MNEVILYHHLGLGDTFICNGLVNYFSEKYDHIFLPCKIEYFQTIRCLYSENDKVTVCPMLNINPGNEQQIIQNFQCDKNIPLIMIGFKDIDHSNFDRQFYELNDLSFGFRYSKFQMPKYVENSDKLYNSLVKDDYILIHKNTSLGTMEIEIDSELDKIYIDPTITNNLLEWKDIVYNAKEIHCVPSSVYCWIDSIYDKVVGKLFYHNIREGTKLNVNNDYNKHSWIIKEYASKL